MSIVLRSKNDVIYSIDERTKAMKQKYMTEKLLLRIDTTLHEQIKSVLNLHTREELKNKSELIRLALKIGLDQLTKEKSK